MEPNIIQKPHRALSVIKAEMTNLWTKPDDIDFVSRRERLNKEFLAAEAAGTPWEIENVSPYKGEIKWSN